MTARKGRPRKKKASALSSVGKPLKKSMGQHLLRNPLLARSIVQKAGIKRTDVVLEIGAGTGNLTKHLLTVAKKVIAIEIDGSMLRELKRLEDAHTHLQVIKGDVLKEQLPYFDVCVANIPYQISSPLLFKLLAHTPRFRCAVIMFQKEFASRLVCKPGDPSYCRLSVNTQLLARVDHLLKVGRNNFRPPPKVDSAVVRIEPRNPLPAVSYREWDGLLRLCFGRKNRTLSGTFRRRSVLQLLEQNYRTAKALQETGCGSSSIVSMGEEAEAMEVDGEQEAEGSSAMKDLVLGMLEQARFAEKRPSKMTQDDFLGLLALFNKAGFRFSS